MHNNILMQITAANNWEISNYMYDWLLEIYKKNAIQLPNTGVLMLLMHLKREIEHPL